MKKLEQGCIVIVGGTGTGKSTLMRKIAIAQRNATGKKIIIFDVNAEHKDLCNTPKLDMKSFLSNAKLYNNNIVVFEEATIFLNHRNGTEDVTNILVRKRHTKNIFIFLFHSLRRVPLWLLDFTDFLIIKKTIDNPSTIRNKFGEFPEIIEAFEEIRESAKKHDEALINLSGI